jgi:hypothetical protein
MKCWAQQSAIIQKPSPMTEICCACKCVRAIKSIEYIIINNNPTSSGDLWVIQVGNRGDDAGADQQTFHEAVTHFTCAMQSTTQNTTSNLAHMRPGLKIKTQTEH